MNARRLSILGIGPLLTTLLTLPGSCVLSPSFAVTPVFGRDPATGSPPQQTAPRTAPDPPAEHPDLPGVESPSPELQRMALAAPGSATASIQGLATYLTTFAHTDRDKAWAAYCWIAGNISYNFGMMTSASEADIQPDVVLRTRSSICSGYSSLYRALTTAMGLNSIAINGYARGIGYESGGQLAIAGAAPNHAWNAVKVDGQWGLVDCTWGAGIANPAAGTFERQFEPFFFLTPPSEFIYSHYPQDSAWQLLDHPMTARDFDSLVDLKPAFFRSGLQLQSNTAGVIETGGQLVVTFSGPPDTMLLGALKQNNQRLDPRLTFTQRRGDRLAVCADFPQPGIYTLEVFSRRRSTAGPYVLAGEYQVQAAAAAPPGGFPSAFTAFADRGAYLYSPLSGTLPAGTDQMFKVAAPGAQNVTVSSGGSLYYLTKTEGVFLGNIPVGGGPVVVHGWYSGGRGEGLLQYVGE